jgi:hypothetical protein
MSLENQRLKCVFWTCSGNYKDPHCQSGDGIYNNDGLRLSVLPDRLVQSFIFLLSICGQ